MKGESAVEGSRQGEQLLVEQGGGHTSRSASLEGCSEEEPSEGVMELRRGGGGGGVGGQLVGVG